MPYPKGFKKQLKLVPSVVGVERREEILGDIAEGGTFLPRGVYYEDMDKSFIDFVSNDLKIEIDGEEVPVIFLTIQRYSEFTKTYKFTDEYKNIKMPFISIVRQPDVQVGTNQAGLYNIPGRQNWTYYKVPSNDGARQGIDIYKVPQPTSTNITYEIRFFTNKMSDLNVLNQKIQKAFNAIQYYIWPKGHPMPVKLENVGDESNIDDFENRRFYVQNFEMLLEGYILDEKDFEVQPTVNRAMILNEIAIDPATAEASEKQKGRGPVIVQGAVVIRNSEGQLIGTSDCGTTFIVGNSQILNSGNTFNVAVPATSGYTLPNVTHYDCDGSPVTIPAMVSFSATPDCLSGTVVNSGLTYTGTVASGGLLELPNITVNANNQYWSQEPSVTNLDKKISNGTNLVGSRASENTWLISASTITNSGNTYTQLVPAESGFTLPNEKIIFYDLTGGTLDTKTFPVYSNPSFTATSYCSPVNIFNSGMTFVQSFTGGTSYQLPNITHTDSDGSNVTLPAQTPFVATPCGTGCTDEYCRPSDWLSKPTLVESDETIWALHAVWYNQANWVNVQVGTTGGEDYQVDWGDGNITTHTSDSWATHQLEYSGVSSATTSTRGYRQSEIQITSTSGNSLDYFSLYQVPSGAPSSSNWRSGFLDIIVASQFCHYPSYAFGTYHNLLEEVRFIGDVIDTGVARLFWSNFGIRKVSGHFSLITDASYFFYQTINLHDLSEFSFRTTGSTINCYGMFWSTGLKELTNNNLMKNMAGAGRLFSDARIERIGVLGTPLDWDSYAGGSLEFLNTDYLTDLHINYSGSIMPYFDSPRLRVISGWDCTNLSGTTIDFSSEGTLQYLGFTHVRGNLNLTNGDITSEEAERIIFDVFDDMTGETSPIFTLTGTPAASTGLSPTAIAEAASKNITLVT